VQVAIAFNGSKDASVKYQLRIAGISPEKISLSEILIKISQYFEKNMDFTSRNVFNYSEIFEN